MCDEIARIKEVYCIEKDTTKFFLYAVLQILSCGILTLLTTWFPKIKLHLLYKFVGLRDATHMGVVGTDNKFHIIEAIEIDLPKLNNSNLVQYCKQSVHSQRTKMFEFKLFKYAYSPSKKDFTAVQFIISTSLDIISRRFIAGLSSTEAVYQRKIFGACDLDIEINSTFKLLSQELADPFYLFQIFSVILWMYNHYTKYAVVIIITTVLSLTISVMETKKNLTSIQLMARYACPIMVYRHIVSFL